LFVSTSVLLDAVAPARLSAIKVIGVIPVADLDQQARDLDKVAGVGYPPSCRQSLVAAGLR